MKTCVLVVIIILLACSLVACETKTNQKEAVETKLEETETVKSKAEDTESVVAHAEDNENDETELERKITAILKSADEIHEGDLIISGNEEKVIENIIFNQRGNVYINDSSTLILRDATFIHSRGDLPTTHANFFVAPNAKLIIEDCTVYNDVTEVMCHSVILNEGHVNINKSNTKIHLIENMGNAKLEITNSKIVNPAGGFLQIFGGKTILKNTTIGALALNVPNDSELNIDNLEPGKVFEEWDVRDWIPKVSYDISFENVTVLEDDFGPGPFDRGFIFFAEPDTKLNVTDAKVRKLFIIIRDEEDVLIENLFIGKPSSLNYKNINLKNITMTGQWPFEIFNSDVTFMNTEGLFLMPSGESHIIIENSHIGELIPREFTGTLHFINSKWEGIGEIIGEEEHHSLYNDFTITGNLEIAPWLRDVLQWRSAYVHRIYSAFVEEKNGAIKQNISMHLDGDEYISNEHGFIDFTIDFDENNYMKQRTLEAFENGNKIGEMQIDFFTTTPIIFIAD